MASYSSSVNTINVAGGALMNRSQNMVNEPCTDYKGLKSNAQEKSGRVLGIARIRKIQRKWANLKTTVCGIDGNRDIDDGILICLKEMGLSHIEIRTIVNAGSPCLSCLHQEKFKSRKENRKPWHHALTPVTVALFCKFIEGLGIEDGFPCAHRLPKHYILSNNVRKKRTWVSIYNNYLDFMDSKLEFLEDHKK